MLPSRKMLVPFTQVQINVSLPVLQIISLVYSLASMCHSIHKSQLFISKSYTL